MTIICKDVKETSSIQYKGAENFIYAYPKTNPPTPLGRNWQFDPCFLPLKYESFKEAF